MPVAQATYLSRGMYKESQTKETLTKLGFRATGRVLGKKRSQIPQVLVTDSAPVTADTLGP